MCLYGRVAFEEVHTAHCSLRWLLTFPTGCKKKKNTQQNKIEQLENIKVKTKDECWSCHTGQHRAPHRFHFISSTFSRDRSSHSSSQSVIIPLSLGSPPPLSPGFGLISWLLGCLSCLAVLPARCFTHELRGEEIAAFTIDGWFSLRSAAPGRSFFPEHTESKFVFSYLSILFPFSQF